MPINQPSNVIKLTNASIVRQRKSGKRFEIVCYKNKVKDWRAGNEKDLDEVLQISQVFLNVSKGQVASSEDLAKAYGADKTVHDIVLLILKDGELQVGEKERGHELESLRKEVCTIVAEKCLDPTTGRPHTASMIEKAMHQIHFGVQTNKSAKSQVSLLSRELSFS
jgi:ribosome maturation protein SDO1